MKLNKKLTLFLMGVQLYCFVGKVEASSSFSGGIDTMPLMGGREQVAPRIGFIGRGLSYLVKLPGIRNVLGCLLSSCGWLIDVAGDEVGGETDEILNTIGGGLMVAGKKITAVETEEESQEKDGEDEPEDNGEEEQGEGNHES
ncbi:MAG: hypothetical protein LBI29_00700 [Rickettsiales bacterium]|nr:hypothetical protein [Rickettsiales bacterium]